MNEKETYVFRPTDKELKVEYPELAEIAEFIDLDDRELRFVWYFSNPTSPIAGKSMKPKLIESINLGFAGKIEEGERLKLVNGKIPDHLKAAIERMKLVSVSIRTQAKIYLNQAFENIQKLIHIDPEVLEGLDFSQKKHYIDLMLKVQDELPKLVDKLERGFSVIEIPKKKKEEEEKSETEEKKKGRGKRKSYADKAVEELDN